MCILYDIMSVYLLLFRYANKRFNNRIIIVKQHEISSQVFACTFSSTNFFVEKMSKTFCMLYAFILPRANRVYSQFCKTQQTRLAAVSFFKYTYIYLYIMNYNIIYPPNSRSSLLLCKRQNLRKTLFAPQSLC